MAITRGWKCLALLGFLTMTFDPLGAPVPPPGGSSSPGSPQHGSPQHGSPQHGSPQHGSPQHGSPSEGLPVDGSLTDGSPMDGSPMDGALLRHALATPTVEGGHSSADPLLEQVRIEGLRAGISGAGLVGTRDVGPGQFEVGHLEPGDLDLLADLRVAEAQVRAGVALPPSPAVLAAAVAALESPAHAEADSLRRDPALPASSIATRVAAGVTPAGSLRLLRGRGAPVGSRLTRVAVAAVAMVVVGLGAWSLGIPSIVRMGSPGEPSGDATDEGSRAAFVPDEQTLASVRRTLADGSGPAALSAGPARVATVPFVEARLWRKLAGSARRGGEGLGLVQGPRAEGADPRTPDVVLSWLPDSLSSEAGRLRVHVRGPAGLLVTLPDLGVEAVLLPTERESAVGGAQAPPQAPVLAAGVAASEGFVDLPLPVGWAGHLPARELRLAFRWPEPGAGQAPDRYARFDGVSLSPAVAVAGG